MKVTGSNYRVYETILGNYVPLLLVNDEPIEPRIGANQYLLYISASLIKLLEQDLVSEAMFEKMRFISDLLQKSDYRTPLIPGDLLEILSACTNATDFQGHHATLKQSLRVRLDSVGLKLTTLSGTLEKIARLKTERDNLPPHGERRAGKAVEEQEQGNPVYIIENPRAYYRAKELHAQIAREQQNFEVDYRQFFIQSICKDPQFEAACHQAFSEKLEKAFKEWQIKNKARTGLHDQLTPEERAKVQKELDSQLLEEAFIPCRLEQIQSLIQRGASPLAIALEGQFKGRSVLMQVVNAKRREVLEYLLPLVAEQVNYRATSGRTAFDYVVEESWIEGLELFQSQFPQQLHWFPQFLIKALGSYKIKPQTLLQLIEKCSTEVINTQDKFGNSMLNSVVMSIKPDESLIRSLLERGANPRLVEQIKGSSPWFNVVVHGEVRIASILYESDRSLLEEVDAKGNTALISVASECYDKTNMLQFLLDCGAKLDVRNQAGQTAVDLAFGVNKRFLQSKQSGALPAASTSQQKDEQQMHQALQESGRLPTSDLVNQQVLERSSLASESIFSHKSLQTHDFNKKAHTHKLRFKKK